MAVFPLKPCAEEPVVQYWHSKATWMMRRSRLGSDRRASTPAHVPTFFAIMVLPCILTSDEFCPSLVQVPWFHRVSDVGHLVGRRKMDKIEGRTKNIRFFFDGAQDKRMAADVSGVIVARSAHAIQPSYSSWRQKSAPPG